MGQALLSVGEFIRSADEEHSKRVATLRWGDWVYDKELMTLTNLKHDYEIDLEEVSDSAAILDWIFQVFNKEWNDPIAVYHLLEALEDLLNPQSNYCSRAILGGSGRCYPARRAIPLRLMEVEYLRQLVNAVIPKITKPNEKVS